MICQQNVKENSDTNLKAILKKLNSRSPESQANTESQDKKLAHSLPIWMSDYMLYKFELFDRNCKSRMCINQKFRNECFS